MKEIVVMQGTEEDFFKRGRRIAQFADAGKPIPRKTILSFEHVAAKLLDVVKVEARPDFKLHLEFENGEKRFFDMSPFMSKKPYMQLHDNSARAQVVNGTVCCPGNIDIALKTLYDRSMPEGL